MHLYENIPLGNRNWFQTGGAARYFCEPTDPQAFIETLTFAHQNQLNITLLGEGANVLISDKGIEGLVIRSQMTGITHDYTKGVVRAGSGASLPRVIQYCLEQGFVGLEEFSGIPGTVGGAVFINIHYFQHLLSDFLVKATVIHRQTRVIEEVDKAWFSFGYNQSRLLENNHCLLDATFALQQTDTIGVAYARGRNDEIARHRAQRYPRSNTCGSFFRNFRPEEIPFEIEGKKILHVAYYLDKIGVKGTLRVGNAVVSHKHANMIVTLPGATTQDVVALAQAMQQLVFDQFGIMPHPECRLLGFKEYPLLEEPQTSLDVAQ